MFEIQFETWKNICNLYCSLKAGYKHAHLQWFPFSKLSPEDIQYLQSKDFFEKFIQKPAFLLYSPMMHQSENFLQKSDGSFRDSSLVSPILYLILQCIGKEISNYYSDSRPADVSVYYAGNYPENRVIYKTDYDDFYKHVNACKENYNYFIKTDVSNFYNNISVDILIDRIDRMCNTTEIHFNQRVLQLYKSFMLYCGHGRFPLIDNSLASSFLATVVYMDQIDCRLSEYLRTKAEHIQGFKMIRYVDDLYIMISSSSEISELTKTYNEIRNEYSSILREYGLTINAKKCCLRKSEEVNDELKKSLYDEYYNGIKCEIGNIFDGKLLDFLSSLWLDLLLDSVDIDRYNSTIDKVFSSQDIEFTPQEVFNYFVYENDSALQTKEIQDAILRLLGESNSFISLDPKRLTVMIMKSKSDAAIKRFLANLFDRNRAKKWNSYDTTIAVTYLIQSKFNHIDLLGIIEKEHPDLYNYYYYNCRSSCLSYLGNTKITTLRETISNDWKAYYLYFMYLCEKQKNNHMAAFAFFKNFFDRVTADIDYRLGTDPKLKKPNYRGFYKEGPIKKVYENIDGSNLVIQKAHLIRNSNPLSHSSSDMLEKYSSEDIRGSICELSKLLFEKNKTFTSS